MKESSKKYADEAFEIVEHAEKKIGSRLPGSEGERKFADFMAEKLKEIGIKPVKEEFSVAPRGGIGGLSYAGYAGTIMSVLAYLAIQLPTVWFLSAAFGIIATAWLIGDVFLYHTWFDMFFKQKISQNVYGELLPENGEYDYTIMLSGHTDTSWNWKHSEHTYKYRNNPVKGLILTYGKVGFGAVCYFLMFFITVYMAVIYFGYYNHMEFIHTVASSQFYEVLSKLLYIIPAITGFGCFFVSMWDDPDPENASKGAMDNATGIALSYEVLKYFKENPDKMPPRCRIVDFNCGSEEAGLRGSLAYTQQHKGEECLNNVWNINIDSVADKDYFEVVIKDDWQFTRFDKDLEKMFKDSFNELGIESKTNGCIHNPVGGCDSTPMTKAGIKSVTFAAQNPMLTWYYHTFRDNSERFEQETVGTGFDVILSVIDKISAFQQENGFNGVNN